jgi:hypothetical protein
MGWGDWLGTGNTMRHRLSATNKKLGGDKGWRKLADAREWVRLQGLRTRADWQAFIKSGRLPSDIPASPWRVSAYRCEGWTTISDWLGSGERQSKKRQWRSFAEARDYVRALGLRNNAAWRELSKSGKLPIDIPTLPDRYYRDLGWQSWGDWLGSGERQSKKRQWRSFAEAKDYVRALGLRNHAQWHDLCKSGKLPIDIPTQPDRYYRDLGWQSWGDWLGSGERQSKKRQWRSFAEARDYVRALGLRNHAQWHDLCKSGKLPIDIPTQPARYYRDLGWQSWGDWFAKRQFRNFLNAREFVRARCFQTKMEYVAWARSSERPPDIPATPSHTYAKTGWQGWGDWLGVHNLWSKTSLLAFVSTQLLKQSVCCRRTRHGYQS